MTARFEKRLHRVIDYIHDNPAGDLSLDALADVAALSSFTFIASIGRHFPKEKISQSTKKTGISTIVLIFQGASAIYHPPETATPRGGTSDGRATGRASSR